MMKTISQGDAWLVGTARRAVRGRLATVAPSTPLRAMAAKGEASLPATGNAPLLKHHSDGMTLVEVVGAVFVLSIGIAGACLLVTQCFEFQSQAGSHYTAINIGKNRLERARAMPYSAIDSLRESMSIEVDSSGNPAAAGDGAFLRTTAVTNVPGRSNLTEVIVTVQIRNRKTLDFGPGSETIRSYFTQYRGE